MANFIDFVLVMAMVLTSVVLAAPAADNRTDQYIISSMVARAYSAGIAGGYNRGITFHWVDQNTQTFSDCNATWTENSTDNTAPSTVVACGAANPSEDFLWTFDPYNTINNFTMRFKHQHEYIDDPKYPEPYNFVVTTAQSNPLLTNCTQHNGSQTCTMPTFVLPINSFCC